MQQSIAFERREHEQLAQRVNREIAELKEAASIKDGHNAVLKKEKEQLEQEIMRINLRPNSMNGENYSLREHLQKLE